MKKLIAKVPILLHNTQYEPGSELPTSDQEYTDAWVSGGAAVWTDDEAEPEAEEEKPKAKPVAARAGRTGSATPTTGDDLVGVVPEPRKRGAVKGPSKRAAKRAD